jgi:hypothetical protein
LCARHANVQRLIVDANGGDPHLIAVDIGGWIAEEIDAVPLGDLLSSGASQLRMGTSPCWTGKAREGTFYIDPNGAAVGRRAAGARIRATHRAVRARAGGSHRATGPGGQHEVVRLIRYLFGDLVSGSAYAVTSPDHGAQERVSASPSSTTCRRAITLAAIGGGNAPDPRFFNFPTAPPASFSKPPASSIA